MNNGDTVSEVITVVPKQGAVEICIHSVCTQLTPAEASMLAAKLQQIALTIVSNRRT